jgi:cytochrome c-type biogenesis protein CcmH
MAAVLVLALMVGTLGDRAPTTNQDRVYAVADTLKCPQCVGQSVADSDVAIAREIRSEIATAVDEGRTDDEIRDDIASSYGEEYLLTPSSSGLPGLVWVIPVLAAVAAFGGLTYYFVRTRSVRPVEASADDRALVDEALEARPRPESGP